MEVYLKHFETFSSMLNHFEVFLSIEHFHVDTVNLQCGEAFLKANVSNSKHLEVFRSILEHF